jgi:hypothetical protein
MELILSQKCEIYILLHFAIASTCLSRLADAHQSPATGFQRKTFLFLDSRIVPHYSRIHSALTNANVSASLLSLAIH